MLHMVAQIHWFFLGPSQKATFAKLQDSTPQIRIMVNLWARSSGKGRQVAPTTLSAHVRVSLSQCHSLPDSNAATIEAAAK